MHGEREPESRGALGEGHEESGARGPKCFYRKRASTRHEAGGVGITMNSPYFGQLLFTDRPLDDDRAPGAQNSPSRPMGISGIVWLVRLRLSSIPYNTGPIIT
jgi:hypothetical protein